MLYGRQNEQQKADIVTDSRILTYTLLVLLFTRAVMLYILIKIVIFPIPAVNEIY